MEKLPFPFVLYFNISGQTISQPGLVNLVDNLNGFSVHNTGTTIVVVNDDTLQPGESKTIGGNWGEIFTGRLFIQFIIPTPAPLVITNTAFITQKFYVSDRFGNPENLKTILGL